MGVLVIEENCHRSVIAESISVIAESISVIAEPVFIARIPMIVRITLRDAHRRDFHLLWAFGTGRRRMTLPF
jgi:hypothetical protein